jgi:Icc protein
VTSKDFIDQAIEDLSHDGVDRRGLLKCMAWARTGSVWTMSGGIRLSRGFAKGEL